MTRNLLREQLGGPKMQVLVDVDKLKHTRRKFLARTAQVVGLAVSSLVTFPDSALAAGCSLGCAVKYPYEQCKGQCSCILSETYCCSPNRLYCDKCVARCYGSGCCYPGNLRRAVMEISNTGCCVCYVSWC